MAQIRNNITEAVKIIRLMSKRGAAAEQVLQLGVEQLEKVEPIRPSDTQDASASEHFGDINRNVGLLKHPPTLTERNLEFLQDQQESQRCCVLEIIANAALHTASFPTKQEMPPEG
jgi:hypothetical protein